MTTLMKPWINSLAKQSQVAIISATMVTAGLAVYLALEANKNAPVFAAAITFLLWVITVAIHEIGHCVGAQLGGMTLWLMNVLGCEIHFQQSGWRLRWSPLSKRRVAGLVVAIPCLSRSIRRQRAWLSASGPGANAVCALLFGFTAWCSLPPACAHLMVALCIVNAGYALANLVPHEGQFPSDGLHLIRLRQVADLNGPEQANVRLLANSLAGCTAELLPESDLTLLEQQPAPAPLITLWYRHKADQNRGAWAAAAARQDQATALIQSMDPATRQGLDEFICTLQAELAFSRAMLTGDAQHLHEHSLNAKAMWLSPWLSLRQQALSQLLAAESASCSHLLAAAMRWANRSKDHSLAPSEMLLHFHMLERHGHSLNSVEHQPSTP